MNKTLLLKLFIAAAVVLPAAALGVFFRVDIPLITEPPPEKLILSEKPEADAPAFLADNFLVGKKENSPAITLVAVGDIMLSRMVAQRMKTRHDYKYPFLKTVGLTRDVDIAFGNLECPITQGRTIGSTEMIFRADPESIKGLKYAGFDVLSLANNHSFNFGVQGLKDTFQYLDKLGIVYSGAGRDKREAYTPKIVEVKGIKIAFLAYADDAFSPLYSQAKDSRAGIAFMKIPEMKKAVAAAKSKADLIIVSMHSGTEYASQPNGKQVAFAHAAIDAGADLIIGHHPHTVQKMEKYKGKYIFYSLGNFVFDQMWSRETKEGLAVKLTLSKDGVREIELIPVLIENYSQPRIMSEAEAQNIFKKLGIAGASFRKKEIFYWNGGGYQKDNQERLVLSLVDQNEKSAWREADLDGDGEVEKIILSGGKVQVLRNGKIIWQSDPAWQVDNLVLADLNRDGKMEINMSLWKKGSYGKDLPFWLEENTKEWGSHLFIYGWRKGKIRPFWCSSTLEASIREMAAGDIDGDGRAELAILEGAYDNSKNARAEYLAVWSWNGWGFFNDYRSEKGRYANLLLEDTNNDGIRDITLLNF